MPLLEWGLLLGDRAMGSVITAYEHPDRPFRNYQSPKIRSWANRISFRNVIRRILKLKVAKGSVKDCTKALCL